MTKEIVIAVDAGHAGFGVTPGKRSPDKEYEWDFNNLVIRAEIARLNQYENVKVIRTDDPKGKVDVALSERARKANAAGAKVFHSAHHNANTSVWGTWTGVETFIMSPSSANPESMKLAKAVHGRLVDAMGLRDRGIKPENFAVLRETKMPAILTEGGFMDSTTDIKKMRNPKYLKAQGEAIADGIAAYLGLKLKEDTPEPIKPEKPIEKADESEYYRPGTPTGLFRVKKACNAYDKAVFAKGSVKEHLKPGDAFTVEAILKVGDVYRLRTKSGLFVTAKKEYMEKV